MSTLSAKQITERDDLRAAFAILRITVSAMEPGIPDPPDWWITTEGRRIPIEHTRVYEPSEEGQPRERLERWNRIKRSLRELNLTPAIELEFRITRDGFALPEFRSIPSFVAALAALVQGHTPVAMTSRLTPTPSLDPYLSSIVLRPCQRTGEVSGTPDVSFLSVANEPYLDHVVTRKCSKLSALAGRAWLFLIFGTDIAASTLGLGDLTASDFPSPPASATIERIYLIDLSTRHAYVYQDACWGTAA
jgi:hypothetical protein